MHFAHIWGISKTSKSCNFENRYEALTRDGFEIYEHRSNWISQVEHTQMIRKSGKWTKEKKATEEQHWGDYCWGRVGRGRGELPSGWDEHIWHQSDWVQIPPQAPDSSIRANKQSGSQWWWLQLWSYLPVMDIWRVSQWIRESLFLKYFFKGDRWKKKNQVRLLQIREFPKEQCSQMLQTSQHRRKKKKALACFGEVQ